jgi:hypothetical protein
MAGNNLRSDRGRDPLAELARLIAQADPYIESASGDTYQNERESRAGERYMPRGRQPSCSRGTKRGGSRPTLPKLPELLPKD